MKLHSFILLFVSLINLASAQNDAVRTQIEKTSTDFNSAVQAGDLTALERLQSPALVYIAANGRRMTRDEVHKAVLADLGKWTLQNTDIEACQVFGNTVVTTGIEEVRTESGAGAGTRTFRRYTNVWQQSGSGWVMISRSVAALSSRKTAVVKAVE